MLCYSVSLEYGGYGGKSISAGLFFQLLRLVPSSSNTDMQFTEIVFILSKRMLAFMISMLYLAVNIRYDIQ